MPSSLRWGRVNVESTGLRRAIARELGGWCPEIGPLSRRPLKAVAGDTYLVVEANQHTFFIWLDDQWRAVEC